MSGSGAGAAGVEGMRFVVDCDSDSATATVNSDSGTSCLWRRPLKLWFSETVFTEKWPSIESLF